MRNIKSHSSVVELLQKIRADIPDLNLLTGSETKPQSLVWRREFTGKAYVLRNRLFPRFNQIRMDVG